MCPRAFQPIEDRTGRGKGIFPLKGYFEARFFAAGWRPAGLPCSIISGSKNNNGGNPYVRALTEAERQYLTETRSLTLDEVGREVLVGLTYEESSLLMGYRRRLAAGSTDEDPAIWLELAERHERARPR